MVKGEPAGTHPSLRPQRRGRAMVSLSAPTAVAVQLGIAAVRASGGFTPRSHRGLPGTHHDEGRTRGGSALRDGAGIGARAPVRRAPQA